jgi:hypothetical protein
MPHDDSALPKAVALMPAWNAESFILPVLESLAAQTYPNLHILISEDASTDMRVEGEFVFAQGRGFIGDPGSTLHRREKFGIMRKGVYISVDTGKYSSAPELADIIAREMFG